VGRVNQLDIVLDADTTYIFLSSQQSAASSQHSAVSFSTWQLAFGQLRGVPLQVKTAYGLGRKQSTINSQQSTIGRQQ
jgi:hypothetical protein